MRFHAPAYIHPRRCEREGITLQPKVGPSAHGYYKARACQYSELPLLTGKKVGKLVYFNYRQAPRLN